MRQRAVPFLFMRGGTSRGPYFLRSDLPADREKLAEVLIAVIGAGHPGNIDGMGGGSAVTTKVAMLSRSGHPDADVDYFFAQVSPAKRQVDFAPSCGNMLAGVGPAAIEMGLVRALDGVTTVRIRAVNTGALIEADIQTPRRRVAYDGTARIDGVPGTAAPIRLSFTKVAGAKTGALFPTGRRSEEIDGIAVSCIDAAMPMVFVRAADLGLTGYESKAEIDADRQTLGRIEAIRIEAGRRMGLGDVTRSVVPKFALVAPPQGEGVVASRYFMPWDCHPSYAVTGAICLSACVLAPGTVTTPIISRLAPPTANILIEHPSGVLEILADYAISGDGFELRKAGTLRTARKLASGQVFIPGAVWRFRRTPAPAGAAALLDAPGEGPWVDGEAASCLSE